MLLDKNNIDSAIVSYTLDGFSMTAKVWSYESKATIFVLDKDVKYNQDFYYVLKGAMPNAGTSIESMNAEMFSNPFDAYAKFQDLLNEEDENSPPPPTPPEDQKIPILLKNKKTNQVEFREVNTNLVVGDDVMAQGFIVDNSKINLGSDDTFETTVFVDGEEFEAILLKLSKLDKDGKDGYFIIPKQPQPPQGPPPEGPEGPPQPPQGPPPEGPEGPPVGGVGEGPPPEIQNEVLSDRVRIISEVSGIDQDIVKNNFRNVNLAVNFLSGINFKELQARLNTDKTAYQLAQEVAQEIRNS